MSRLSTAVRARSPIWWAVLAVATCGVAATAHGLFEVARACSIAVPIAAVYPVIADGLALVAYASIDHLRRAVDRAYAWFVVVLAAGLSATAQGIVGAGIEAPSRDVRFWVHFAPAVAVLLAMHLRWLVARADAPAVAPQVSASATAVAPVATSNPEPAELEHATDVPTPVATAPEPVAEPAVRPDAPVSIHRPRSVAATGSRRSQVSAPAGRKTKPSRAPKPCVEGCDRHAGPVSYDTRKRCAERLAATA